MEPRASVWAEVSPAHRRIFGGNKIFLTDIPEEASEGDAFLWSKRTGSSGLDIPSVASLGGALSLPGLAPGVNEGDGF